MSGEPRAIDYACLIGRHVDMERPSTQAELDAGYPETNGMRCLVAGVEDVDAGVLIITDEGLASLVTAQGRDVWRFAIRAEEWVR